jgi:hypothetical protein
MYPLYRHGIPVSPFYPLDPLDPLDRDRIPDRRDPLFPPWVFYLYVVIENMHLFIYLQIRFINMTIFSPNILKKPTVYQTYVFSFLMSQEEAYTWVNDVSYRLLFFNIFIISAGILISPF